MDPRAHDLDLHELVATQQGSLDVIDDLAGDAAYDGDARAEARNGPLAGRIREALGLELGTQRLDLPLKRPLTGD